MVEKQVHAFEHFDEIKCNSTNKHLHTEEHHCSICDFTLTDSASTPELNFECVIYSEQYLFPLFLESVSILNTFNHLPSRAPPVA